MRVALLLLLGVAGWIAPVVAEADAIDGRLALTAEEQAWLDQGHTVRVRVAPFPPYVILDSDEPDGMSVDYLKLIAERTGINLTFARDDRTYTDSIRAMANSQGPDLMPCLVEEPGRGVAFSDSYLISPYVIITQVQGLFISGIEDLRGKTLATTDGVAVRLKSEERYPEIDLRVFDADVSALRAVSTGQADAYIGDLTLASHDILANGLSNLKVAAPSPLPDREFSFGIRPDWPELRSIIDKVLSSISPGEQSAIRSRFLTVRYEHGVSQFGMVKWLLGIGGIIVLIVTAFVTWNAQLRQQVRERTAEILRREERFRATFEQAAVGIAHVAPDGRFLRINQKFCDLVGYSQEEVLERTFQAITHPEDLDADVEHVQSLLRGEADTYSTEKRYLRKDGEILWVNLTVSLVREESGLPGWFVSVVEDIATRKKAEVALRDSEANLRDAQRMARLGNWAWDIGTDRIRWSGEVHRIAGIRPDTPVTYELLMAAIHPEDRDYHNEHTGQWLEGKHCDPFEYRIVRPDGTIRHVHGVGQVVRDDAGEPIRMYGTLQDITERKQAEGMLRESETNFRHLVERFPLSIEVLDPDGRITMVNQSFKKLWGVSEETLPELIEKYNILEDEVAVKLGVMPLIERAFLGESVVLPLIDYDASSTINSLDMDGSAANRRWIRARLFPIKNQNGEVTGVVDIEEDMTEAKAAEEKLEDYQRRLRALGLELTVSEERERRRIASELHDNAAQSLALARLRLAATAKRITDDSAASSLDDASQLVKDSLRQIRELILDLSSPELIEIGLAAAISEWLERHVSRRHGLQTSFADDCGNIEMDEDTLAVIFRGTRELLANVIKHAQARRVSVRLDWFDDALQITVTDDGCGFATDAPTRRPDGEGAFGLFSVRERMTDLGGALEIESVPGHGCTARLRVPQDRLTNGEKP